MPEGLKKVDPTYAFLLLIDCISSASAFQHQGQSGTAVVMVPANDCLPYLWKTHLTRQGWLEAAMTVISLSNILLVLLSNKLLSMILIATRSACEKTSWVTAICPQEIKETCPLKCNSNAGGYKEMSSILANQ